MKAYRRGQREMIIERAGQLRRLANETKSLLHRAQEEKEKATKALQKEKDEVLVQLRAMKDSVTTHESEKVELQAKLHEEKRFSEA